MRKALLLLAAAVIVAAPTAAMAKHRRHVVHAPAPAPDPNPFDPGWRVFWTGVDSFFLVPFRTVLVVAPPPVVAKY